MCRRLICLLFLAILTTAALSQMSPSIPLGGPSEIDPVTQKRILLSNYCRLDFEGARLSPDGWNRFKTYTSMRANPEFNRIVIVTRYNVENPQIDAPLFVTFQAVGYYDLVEGYVASNTRERVEFQLEDRRENLLVSYVIPESPHVSPRAAIAWMNLRLADPKTSDLERGRLKDAVNQLNKFLPQPRPAAAAPGV